MSRFPMESRHWTPITYGNAPRIFTPDIGFILKGLKVFNTTHCYFLLRDAYISWPRLFEIDFPIAPSGVLNLVYNISEKFKQIYHVHYHSDFDRVVYDKIEAEDCYRVLRPIVVFKN